MVRSASRFLVSLRGTSDFPAVRPSRTGRRIVRLKLCRSPIYIYSQFIVFIYFLLSGISADHPQPTWPNRKPLIKHNHQKLSTTRWQVLFISLHTDVCTYVTVTSILISLQVTFNVVHWKLCQSLLKHVYSFITKGILCLIKQCIWKVCVEVKLICEKKLCLFKWAPI